MDQDFLYFLEQLEQHVMTARAVPFTDKVLVDEQLVYQLVDQLRDSLPETLHRAERILRDRDDIIRQAQERAEDTVQGAEEYVRELASETEVAQLAREQAEQIVTQAEQTGREIQLGSRAYADDMLGDAEAVLERCLQAVRSGRTQLQVAATRESELPPEGDR